MKQGMPLPPSVAPMQLPPHLQKIMADPVYLAELMENPTWEEVEALLRDDAMLGFRIDIETDSTIKQDEEAEKASRIELIGAISQFIGNAAAIQDPAVKVFMAELLGFGVRGFNAGKQIEGAVDLLIKKIEDEAKNPPPPPPNPEVIKAQAQVQQKQAEMQLNQQKAQQEAALEQQEYQSEAQNEQYKQQMEAEREAMKQKHEMDMARERMVMEMQMKRETALYDAETRRMAASAAAAAQSEGGEGNATS